MDTKFSITSKTES